jgi:hypothetical protein
MDYLEKDKQGVKILKNGECYTVPQSDYGLAEIWYINDIYFLFGIPLFGGAPYYVDNFYAGNWKNPKEKEEIISKILDIVHGWT